MQGELFQMSGAVTEASKVSSNQSRWIDLFRVTLRLDHLSVLSISALVLYVLVFSFGVEKGKQIALGELEAQRREAAAVKESSVEAVPEAVRPAPLKEAPSVDPLASPEVVEVTPSPGVGRYTIQVITFTSESRAEEEVKRFQEKGYQSFIIPGGRFFQVCVDRFENLTEAREKLLRLRAGGFAPPDAFIRPVKGQVSL